MKTRPILFSGPMVRALLAGSKTQTRRLVKARAAPYGAAGDRLYVRETWCEWASREARYRADFKPRYGAHERDMPGMIERVEQWKPSIFMPRWASRILLDVTSVRVEKLQAITEEDARAEGLTRLSKDGGRTWKWGLADRDGLPGTDDDGMEWQDWDVDARRPYAKLWDRINGDRAPWESDPMVWVIGFRRAEAKEAK